MIIAFLILYNYTTSLLKYIGLNKLLGKDEWAFLIFDVPVIEGRSIYTESKDLRFIPPLYLQRYDFVKQVLKSADGILKVVDFGCSEIAFFQIIKHMKGIQEYIAVDIDNETLNRYSCRVQPLTYDYLKKRDEPLVVQILCGSVTQPDLRLQNSNAVVAIELIEHLYPDALEELPYNIFGLIQPEIAVFTTPNSEYNVFFRNFNGFRHLDHKFEWTRQQFQSWAKNLISRYPQYKVVFGGVGSSPDCRRDVGYCTQIAIFIRNTTSKIDTASHFSDVYKAVRKVDYPFYTDSEKLESIINDGTEKFIKYHSNLECYQVDGHIEIPLKDIHHFILKECSYSEEALGKVLTSCGWKIDVLKNNVRTLILYPSGADDDSYISSNSSLEDHDIPYATVLTEEEEVWDTLIFDTMNPVSNGIEEAVATGPSSDEMELQEPVNLNNISSPNTSPPPETINVTSIQSVIHSEEARSSGSNKKTSNSYSLFEQNSCCSTDVLDEKSENSALFLRSPLQKCHSLENVNKDRSKNNTCRFSLNIDKYKVFNCDIACSENRDLQKVSSAQSVSDNYAPRQEDSCSQSKAVDSGYPNSFGQDMDMDLTPEQVDEIITESESSFDGDVEDESGGEEDEPPEIRGEIVRLGENVENGDVANNNRDGEGNNMEAIAAGGILQFEQVIAEEEVVVGNLAAAVLPALEENLDFLSVHERIIVPDRAGDDDELPRSAIQEAGGFFVPVNNIVFPEWLLHILADDLDSNEEVVGAGDALIVRDLELEVESTNSENDEHSDIELFEEIILPGDLMGGGEPPPVE